MLNCLRNQIPCLSFSIPFFFSTPFTLPNIQIGCKQHHEAQRENQNHQAKNNLKSFTHYQLKETRYTTSLN